MEATVNQVEGRLAPPAYSTFFLRTGQGCSNFARGLVAVWSWSTRDLDGNCDAISVSPVCQGCPVRRHSTHAPARPVLRDLALANMLAGTSTARAPFSERWTRREREKHAKSKYASPVRARWHRARAISRAKDRLVKDNQTYQLALRSCLNHHHLSRFLRPDREDVCRTGRKAREGMKIAIYSCAGSGAPGVLRVCHQ